MARGCGLSHTLTHTQDSFCSVKTKSLNMQRVVLLFLNLCSSFPLFFPPNSTVRWPGWSWASKAKKTKQGSPICNLHNQTTTLTNPPGQRNLWLTCKRLQTRIHSAKTKTLAQWGWCLFSNTVLRRQSVLNPHAAFTMWNVSWWCPCTPLLHYICICIAKSLAEIGPTAYGTGDVRHLHARFLRENFIPTDAFICHKPWHDLSLPNCQKKCHFGQQNETWFILWSEVIWN